MTKKKVKLPKSCRWAVEDTLALANSGYEKAIQLHQSTNDAALMHKLLDIMEVFRLITETVKNIGVEGGHE